jgi:hypothetical protein
MRTSNQFTALCCAFGMASSVLPADELTLAAGDSRLSGTVRSINEHGVVELASELSPEPLLLRDGMLRKVRFSGGKSMADTSPAVIELANGDLLPGSIGSLDERLLTFVSPHAGRLEIPRAALKSMQLGVRRHAVVYSGPKNLEEWSDDGGEMRNWIFERKSLVSRGPSTASKLVDLPEQFILRFNLRWQARNNPNFQVFFADPMVEKGVAADRYYLQFGGAGLEIKRESSTGKRYHTVGLLNRTPNQYPENQIQVEIRVIRTTSRIQLFLNDEPEGEFVDPIPTVPEGSGIRFVCNTSNGSTQEISGIEILEFDDKRGRHGAEDRGDPETDSLISRDEDRWSGALLGINPGESESVFHFKLDDQDVPMEIPESDVSTVFFATGSGKPAAAAAGNDKRRTYVLRLRGQGSLTVDSCLFTEDRVSAVHSLLGPLELHRDGIEAMEREQPEAENLPEP